MANQAVQGGNYLLKTLGKMYQKQVGKSLTAYGLKYDDIINEHCPDTKVRKTALLAEPTQPACSASLAPRPKLTPFSSAALPLACSPLLPLRQAAIDRLPAAELESRKRRIQRLPSTHGCF